MLHISKAQLFIRTSEVGKQTSYLSTQDKQGDEEYGERHGAHGLQVFPNAWPIKKTDNPPIIDR